MEPVTISLPGAGMIAVLSRQYQELTDDFIQQWMYELARDYRVSPTYLLVTEEVGRNLQRIVAEDWQMHMWAQERRWEGKGECYPNKATGGEPLSIVVFPGLPEKAILVASLLEMKHEEKRVKDAISYVTRTYAPMKDYS